MNIDEQIEQVLAEGKRIKAQAHNLFWFAMFAAAWTVSADLRNTAMAILQDANKGATTDSLATTNRTNYTSATSATDCTSYTNSQINHPSQQRPRNPSNRYRWPGPWLMRQWLTRTGPTLTKWRGPWLSLSAA